MGSRGFYGATNRAIHESLSFMDTAHDALPDDLDALRAAGWKGSGLVRWAHPSNRGFLRCLDGLRSSAGSIGEHAEEERCSQFLRQLDPSWRPDWTGIPA